MRTPLHTMHMGLKLLASEIIELIQATLVCDSETNDCNDSGPGKAMIGKLKDWLSLIADIEESTDMANVVLNDLVNYDKISMGNLVTEFKLHSLWELVATAVNPFKVQARRKGVSLVVKLELHQEGTNPVKLEGLQQLVCLCDDVKIIQVVRNLVSNAIKFTPSGGTVTVKVEWDVTGLLDAVTPTTGKKNVASHVLVSMTTPVPVPIPGIPTIPEVVLKKSVDPVRNLLSERLPALWRNNKVHARAPRETIPESSLSTELGDFCDIDAYSVASSMLEEGVHFSCENRQAWTLHASNLSTVRNVACTGVQGTLTPRPMLRAGSVVITVSDTGAGMSQEDQKSLFGEGIQFRVNQLQAGQGSGLGLWISKGE
jgi:signal transduction histidine kinase